MLSRSHAAASDLHGVPLRDMSNLVRAAYRTLLEQRDDRPTSTEGGVRAGFNIDLSIPHWTCVPLSEGNQADIDKNVEFVFPAMRFSSQLTEGSHNGILRVKYRRGRNTCFLHVSY